MQILRFAALFALLTAAGAVLAQPILAQPKGKEFGAEEETAKGPKLGEPRTERWRVGVIVTAASGTATDVVSDIQLPVDWPEQQVKVVQEEFPPFAPGVEYRMVDTVKEFVLKIPQVPAGQEAKALITFEITRFPQSPPDDVSILKKAETRKLPKDLRRYLGPSPRIESQNGKIKGLAKKLMKEAEDKSDWEKVQAIFQWVRDHVKPEDGVKQPGALQAMREEASDHEGLSSLFIALCRASDIPARTVWVPNSSYPEFYLVDDEGKGHWFPCQLTSPTGFGSMPEAIPIWQKGDNFRSPEAPREPVRYMPSHLTARGSAPSVKWVRELVQGGL